MPPGTPQARLYDADAHVADLYDKIENDHDDLDLITHLIERHALRSVLEPFCGTGRIVLPLMELGCRCVGMDASVGMITRARKKLSSRHGIGREASSLMNGDVLSMEWPGDFDLVILGGNCFYELATAADQELCIQKAARSLRRGIPLSR
jgi:SAM-dependent methyltransferase